MANIWLDVTRTQVAVSRNLLQDLTEYESNTLLNWHTFLICTGLQMGKIVLLAAKQCEKDGLSYQRRHMATHVLLCIGCSRHENNKSW